MNRRDALKTLAALPLAGAVLPATEIPAAVCDCDCCPLPATIDFTLSDNFGNVLAEWREKFDGFVARVDIEAGTALYGEPCA